MTDELSGLALPQELLDLLTACRQMGETHVVEIGDRRWRLVVANERVRCEVDYRGAQRGRIVWLRSTLEVDGQPRPIATDFDHLLRIFQDPDHETGLLVEVPELLPQARYEDAPVIARSAFDRLAQTLGADRVRMGHLHTRWEVSITTPTRTLRIYFVRRGRKVSIPADYVRLFVNGRDESHQVRNDVARAMALMGTPTVGPSSGDAEPGQTAGAEGFGSVGVRRHSVMRN